MALPTNYRWISVGKIKILNRNRSPEGAPPYELMDLINALRGSQEQSGGKREYQRQTRLMWCHPISDRDQYYCVLAQVGDRDVSDTAWYDFETDKTRDSGKRDTEGAHYCAHILIRKRPDASGRHLLLLEKVPGINFSSLKAHFNWILNRATPKTFDVDEEEKTYWGKSEIDGFQSKTLQQAMTSGTILDLQLIGHEAQEQGQDEADLIRETSRQIKWDVRRQVDAEGARRLLRLGFDKVRGWTDVEANSKELLVRLQSDEGQVKTVEVAIGDGNLDEVTQEALENAFMLNEKVSDFELPLTQNYENIRDDMVTKLVEKAIELEEA
ncbi:hypothetical protein [Vreelandella titanicae]|uniref:hypothetical protein n=1 Tax=Vreelandella titanicae TaxID=664683 RepID=UPI001681AD34|nr:hypothetical protein [Halomonas titanicae]QNU63669.1 hypothetical protein HZS52_04745 [Halomonas titanicae]